MSCWPKPALQVPTSPHLVSLVLTALLCAFVCVVLRVFSLITAEFPTPPQKLRRALWNWVGVAIQQV